MILYHCCQMSQKWFIGAAPSYYGLLIGSCVFSWIASLLMTLSDLYSLCPSDPSCLKNPVCAHIDWPITGSQKFWDPYVCSIWPTVTRFGMVTELGKEGFVVDHALQTQGVKFNCKFFSFPFPLMHTDTIWSRTSKLVLSGTLDSIYYTILADLPMYLIVGRGSPVWLIKPHHLDDLLWPLKVFQRSWRIILFA